MRVPSVEPLRVYSDTPGKAKCPGLQLPGISLSFVENNNGEDNSTAHKLAEKHTGQAQPAK
jgi:hypothetical protein